MTNTYLGIPVPTPTQDPVPSAKIQDHVFAGAKLDEWATSEQETYVDRLGNTHLTNAGLIANLSPLGKTYTQEQAAAAIASGEIPDGAFYFIWSDDEMTIAEQYKNAGGAQEKTGKVILNDAGIKQLIEFYIRQGLYMPDYFPIAFDRAGNVLMWSDNGGLDANKFGPVLWSFINDFVKGLLKQGVFSPDYFPVAYDRDGNVLLWSDNGAIDANKFGPVLRQNVIDIVNHSGVSSSQPGETLHKQKWKKTKSDTGTPSKLVYAYTGNSWTDLNDIPIALQNVMTAGGMTAGDQGYADFNPAAAQRMNNTVASLTNFTQQYSDSESHGTNPPQFGVGPNGKSYTCVTKTGVAQITGLRGTNIDLYFWNKSSSFEVSIDGAAPVTLTGNGSDSTGKYSASGLSAGSAHTIRITTTTNTGTVSIFGVNAWSPANSGFTVHKLGHNGAIADDYTRFTSWITPVVKDLDIDVLFIICCTNDFRRSRGVAEYKNGIRAIANAYRAATPTIGICLVTEPQMNATGNPQLSAYDNANADLAIEFNCEHYSGYNNFPNSYAVSSGQMGMFRDAWHLNGLGARYLTNDQYKAYIK
ncbi:Uncharacterised protein [Serratia entomophila]|uniref:SGNH/GDSL hydrolase family protein n=1 Tax=Serratia entomophila TaxID=42906 RepID=UPI0021777F73|nr:SGNH/GDSL hydrolase family protein [Serratia entomophila]CAI2085844.1 Uncharacterised protein [Serratia entomophila]